MKHPNTPHLGACEFAVLSTLKHCIVCLILIQFIWSNYPSWFQFRSWCICRAINHWNSMLAARLSHWKTLAIHSPTHLTPTSSSSLCFEDLQMSWKKAKSCHTLAHPSYFNIIITLFALYLLWGTFSNRHLTILDPYFLGVKQLKLKPFPPTPHPSPSSKKRREHGDNNVLRGSQKKKSPNQ